MPNVCENTLVVSGNITELEKFKVFADKDKNVLNHQKFIPRPKKFVEADKQDENKAFNLNKYDENDKKYLVDGINEYDWNCKNLGTKWGIYNASLQSGNVLTYTFDTAWSPPIPIIKKMSEMFPKLIFELNYEESGARFEGDIYYENGEVTFEEERDYVEYCDECGEKKVSAKWVDKKDMTLCEECNLEPLQKLVKKTIEDINEKV